MVSLIFNRTTKLGHGFSFLGFDVHDSCCQAGMFNVAVSFTPIYNFSAYLPGFGLKQLSVVFVSVSGLTGSVVASD